MHAFRSDTQLIHAVWTTNGDVAAACDLYRDTDLATAQCLDRDGEPLPETPTLFTESPLYLVWPAETTSEIQPEAKLLPGIRIHRHQPSLTHYYLRDAQWHGMVLARNRAEADLLISALHPDNIGAPPAKRDSLRLARNATWTIPDPREQGRLLVAKKPVKHHLHKKLLDRLKPSKARRSWSGAAELQRRGLTTANPVAWFEQRSGTDITRNWYVCEHVENAIPSSALFSAINNAEPLPFDIPADALLRELAAFIRKMHDHGIFFRDLSGGNILVQFDDGELRFKLIDTARACIFTKGLPSTKRLADLTRATYKLDTAGRTALLQHYFNSHGKPLAADVRLRFAVYEHKARLKRRLRQSAAYQVMKR